VTVLDSQAIIAGLRGEPAMDQVAGLLRGGDGIPMVSPLTLGEIVDVLVRTSGVRVDTVDARVRLLLAGGLEVVPVDAEVGRLAGLLRARHWDRDRRAVSLADCVVLATGMVHREPVATADAALIAAARSEGHPVIPLPDSQGRPTG
jgi:PIN domain nuclease of toxin-antitoxin system